MRVARKRRVVLYGSRGCGWCARERAFLDGKGVKYEYREVDNEKVAEELVRLTKGELATPVLRVGRKVVVGFDPGEIEKALG